LKAIQFSFSPKSQQQCGSNYSEKYGAKWKSYFEWLPARMVPGNPKKILLFEKPNSKHTVSLFN
jgi:hypothetical protein